MDLIDAIYKQCHDHLRDADKKRDQLIAFYAIIVGFFFAADDKIDARVKALLPLIVGLVGVFILFAVIQYRKWHLIYSNSFNALQDAVHQDPNTIKADLLEAAWQDINCRGFWKQFCFFNPATGTEAATFAALVVLSFSPWYIVLKSIPYFPIKSDAAGFVVGGVIYWFLATLVGMKILQWSANKDMYSH